MKAQTLFTVDQIANFKAYRKVQMGGRYNMFDRRAIDATGLSKDEYMFVMNNYGQLETAAGQEN